MIVQGADGQREVDARPSDAVNLALIANAPILIDGELFDTDYPSDHTGAFAASSVVTADLAARAISHLTQATSLLEAKEQEPDPR